MNRKAEFYGGRVYYRRVYYGRVYYGRVYYSLSDNLSSIIDIF